MIRHLRIRSKILVLLAVPLIAVFVLAGVSVNTRLADVESARTAEALTTATHVTWHIAQWLEVERRAAILAVEGSTAPEPPEGLADPRGRADFYRAFFQPTGIFLPPDFTVQKAVPDAAVEAEVMALIEPLLDILTRLEPLRADIDDEQLTASQIDRRYRDLIEPASQTTESLAALGPADIAQDLAVLVGAMRLGHALSHERLIIERVTTQDDYSGADHSAYVARIVAIENAQTTIIEGMDGDVRTRFLDSMPSPNSIVDLTRRSAMRWSTLPAIDLDEFATASDEYQLAIDEIGHEFALDFEARMEAASLEARDEALRFGGVAGGVVLFTLLMSALLTRQTVRPLRQLTELAQDVSERQLPRLVDALGREDGDAAEIDVEPIEMDSRDEIGRLASAFDEIRAVAVSTATDLSELTRKGISDLFVNLARRNQSLLDRQIATLDSLERDEDDPQALEQLFTLDHLATRMRRNAESLLVLAGSDTPRRWSAPVPLNEVIRAASGEVEAYARVESVGLHDWVVSGKAAADLAHLLAELLENATAYSPPDTTVSVSTRSSEDGVIVQIVDQGLGMSPDALAEANRLLTNPPLAGFGLSRSLGFIVAGLLAQRHGVRVLLESAPDRGTTAEALIPSELLAGPDDSEPPSVDQQARADLGAGEQHDAATTYPDESGPHWSPPDDAARGPAAEPAHDDQPGHTSRRHRQAQPVAGAESRFDRRRTPASTSTSIGRRIRALLPGHRTRSKTRPWTVPIPGTSSPSVDHGRGHDGARSTPDASARPAPAKPSPAAEAGAAQPVPEPAPYRSWGEATGRRELGQPPPTARQETLDEATALPRRQPADSAPAGSRDALPTRTRGSSDRPSAQESRSGLLTDELAATPGHEATDPTDKDTSDILSRYLTGMSRHREAHHGDPAGTSAPHQTPREDRL